MFSRRDFNWAQQYLHWAQHFPFICYEAFQRKDKFCKSITEKNIDRNSTNQGKNLHGIEKFFVVVVSLILSHKDVQFINQFRLNLKINIY